MHHHVDPAGAPRHRAHITAQATAVRAAAGHRGRRLLVVMLSVTLVAVVLRSPQSVLSIVGAPAPTDRHDAGGRAAPVPMPGDIAVDTVPRSVTGASGGGHDIADRSITALRGDGADGRSGASQVRPGGLDILLEELRGGWRVEAGAEEAAALAVIAAHAWADARDASGSASGTSRRSGTGQGVIVTVEAVERPAALHAVVTLLVVVGHDLHRIAVPIAFGATGPALAGAPWSLPPPTALPSDLSGTAIDDPELIDAARRALEAVGIDGQDLVALEATSGWPFVARLADDTRGHPWLRWHLDRFVVSGLPLRTGGGSR